MMMNLTSHAESHRGGLELFANLAAKLLGRKPAFSMRLGQAVLSFRNIADFEFALSGRSSLPLDKFAELMTRSAEELKTEALSIKAVEQRLTETLERYLQHPGRSGSIMRDLALTLFSKDHHWREIFETLKNDDRIDDEFRRVALTKYLQYLSARQETLNTLYWLKTLSHPKDELVDTANPIARTMLKETVIFDVSHLESSRRMLNELERLPRGESVVLNIPPGEAAALILVKHRFQLSGGEKWVLIDEGGNEYPLGEGRNTVGRDSTNSVVLDNSYRVVSRRHLMIEPLSAMKVRVTDLSSHGTFVSPQFFDRNKDHQAA